MVSVLHNKYTYSFMTIKLSKDKSFLIVYIKLLLKLKVSILLFEDVYFNMFLCFMVFIYSLIYFSYSFTLTLVDTLDTLAVSIIES